MREIKFRAWDLQRKRLVTNPSIDYSEEVGFTNMYDEQDRQVEDWKLMQFTGLKDKNGKEIYEGDIMSWNEKELMKSGKEKITGIIIYWTDGFTIETETVNYSLHGRYNSIEVIGNIYEHKHLLENSK